MSTHRPKLARAVWRASSYSAASGNCVEVTGLTDGGRAVRDSKKSAGSILTFTASAWSAFAAGVASGEFD